MRLPELVCHVIIELTNAEILDMSTFVLFQIKMVNINPSDVVDGKPTIVLGLIWTIILYFQVRNLMLSDECIVM